MEFLNVLKRRRSVRFYDSRMVEEEKLRAIFEAANTAPSAYNLQAYEAFIIRGEHHKEALSKAAYDQSYVKQNFILAAPISLVFCANPSRVRTKYQERGANLFSVQDATIATVYAMLAATDLGLSTVWVGAFDEEKVKDVIGDRSLRPVAILPIGYSREEPKPTRRRPIDELFHEIK